MKTAIQYSKPDVAVNSVIVPVKPDVATIRTESVVDVAIIKTMIR